MALIANSKQPRGDVSSNAGVATSMGKGNPMNSWGGGGQTISPKNATPKTTPHQVGDQGVKAAPKSPMPANNLAQNQNRMNPAASGKPMYNPPRVPIQMDTYGGNPGRMDTSKFGQQTVAGDLFNIQGYVRGGT